MQKYPDKNAILVGHSLGRSIVCRIVKTLTNVEKLERIFGCIIIDVVEGTAYFGSYLHEPDHCRQT